jgi:hypothetical protein
VFVVPILLDILLHVTILHFFKICFIYFQLNLCITVGLKGMVVYLHNGVTGLASHCVTLTFITVCYVT